MIKAMYVMREDLNMSSAKLAVQVGHGTDFIHVNSHNADDCEYDGWIEQNRRKIVVRIKTEIKLKNLMKVLDDNNILYDQIWDAGYTEFDGATFTGIVIQPIDDSRLPKAVTRLRLL